MAWLLLFPVTLSFLLSLPAAKSNTGSTRFTSLLWLLQGSREQSPRPGPWGCCELLHDLSRPLREPQPSPQAKTRSPGTSQTIPQAIHLRQAPAESRQPAISVFLIWLLTYTVSRTGQFKPGLASSSLPIVELVILGSRGSHVHVHTPMGTQRVLSLVRYHETDPRTHLSMLLWGLHTGRTSLSSITRKSSGLTSWLFTTGALY